MAESTTKHEAIEFSYPLDLASCTRIIDMGMAMAMECTHFMQVYITIRMGDAFILNCRRRPPWYPWGVKNKLLMQSIPDPSSSCEGAGTQTREHAPRSP